MNVINKIADLARAALQPTEAVSGSAPSDALAQTERRIEQLQDDIQRLQAEQQAEQVRRQSADALVAKLTDQAAAGKLKDPTRLTEALRQQREVAKDSGLAARLRAIQQEKTGLVEQTYALKRAAAHEVYRLAVLAYAEAAGRAGLPELAVKVRELAPGAGAVMHRCAMCGHDGMHGHAVTIGGAVVDLPRV